MYSTSYPALPAGTPHQATPELEAVARAVCREFNRDWRGGRPEEWAAVVEAEWPDFLVEARAALEALRALTGSRPTPEDLDRILDGPGRPGPKSRAQAESGPALG